MKTHSFTDPDAMTTWQQKRINKYFNFDDKNTATCNAHEVRQCQWCSTLALREKGENT